MEPLTSIEHRQALGPVPFRLGSAVAALLVFLIPVDPLPAQIADFANVASDSAGDLYLNSSLILRTAKPALAGNIFHYTSQSGWEWFSPPWGPANGSVDVSSDGSVMAITNVQEELQCNVSNCQYVPVASAVLMAPGYRLNSFAGYIQISRSGRYAVLSAGNSNTLLDLTTGLSTTFSGRLAASGQAVTDSGCTLLNRPHPRASCCTVPQGTAPSWRLDIPTPHTSMDLGLKFCIPATPLSQRRLRPAGIYIRSTSPAVRTTYSLERISSHHHRHRDSPFPPKVVTSRTWPLLRPALPTRFSQSLATVQADANSPQSKPTPKVF